MKVAVIIPYFQRKPGILSRALRSILSQVLPQDVWVHVIVVDDGSPIPSTDEVKGLAFENPFSLELVTLPNGGVANARNTGLDRVYPDTDCVAFLDSDDIWNPVHLAMGIEVINNGCDFYFCDNRRPGHHDSLFTEWCPFLMSLPEKLTPQGFVAISSEDALDSIVREFPCQVSTTIHRRTIAPELRFASHYRYAGEDVLYFAALISKANKIAFRKQIFVECGDGINMYFQSYDWDSPNRRSILLDQVNSHTELLNTVPLSRSAKKWLRKVVASYTDALIFHSIRYFRNTRRIPAEFLKVMSGNLWHKVSFSLRVIKVICLTSLRLYRP